MKNKKSFLLIDSEVPAIFKIATGRRYSDKEMCVNDLRRFFDVSILHCIGKAWKNEKASA